VEKGVLLGIVTNSYAVDLLAGEKAVEVLKGANISFGGVSFILGNRVYSNDDGILVSGENLL
jgi:regulator of RNase E activity RraA